MAQVSTTLKSRVTVKMGNQQQQMNPVQVELTLERLESAINQIHCRNASQLSFEELYRSAYNLVMQKHGNSLYERVKDTLERNFKSQRDKLKKTPDASLLDALSSVWKDHIRSISMVRDVLMYLDKSWVMTQPNSLSVYDQGNALFLQTIIRDDELSPRIVSLVLSHIARHRVGELVDLTALHSTYSMLQQLGGRSRLVVEELFEHPCLKATEEYYAQASNQMLVTSTAATYLAYADAKLREEKKLAMAVFPDLEIRLNKVLQRELVLKHAMQVIEMPNSGLIAMVKADKFDDLRLLFQILDESISPALAESARLFGEYLASNGLAIVQAPIGTTTASSSSSSGVSKEGGEAGEASMGGTGMSLSQLAVSVVNSLMNEKEKCETIIRNSFKSHKLFQKAAKEAFEASMNQDVRCAQYLAIYVDELLTGKMSESKGNIELVLDKLIGLFRFLSDKDVFESYYKAHLSKRLLGQRSISQDFERTMIAKLKSECGHQFTSKLEGMFKDMSLSTDSSIKFREELARKQSAAPGSRLDFSVSVLTSGFWPASVHYQDEAAIRLPRELGEVKKDFETFYLASHTGRALMWNYALGSCEVKVTGFETGVHEFTVSPLQCITMLAFNEGKKPTRTFQQLLQETGIPREDMKRHLISMAVPRFQLFNKTGLKREFLDEDVYEFNTQYKSKLRKVKIPLVSMSNMSSGSAGGGNGDDDNPAAIPQAVIESRRHLMEAAIVRVMKSRKRMDHNNLLAEVVKHLKFRPSPQEIKKRIESLIEREYLERDEKDMRFYSYLA